MNKRMLSILVSKFKLHTNTRSRYWYIVGLTNFEMLQLMKVNVPITHPTYNTKEQLETELKKGITRTFSAVYINPDFNPENLYKLLKN